MNDGGTRVPVGDQVFINIGTHAAIPNVLGLDAAGPLTNIEALELDYVPQHLIVLGGGYVGLELAQAYRRFGSRITIIEHGPQLAGREDPDVADEMRRILSDEGIDILVAAEIRRVQGRSGRLTSPKREVLAVPLAPRRSGGGSIGFLPVPRGKSVFKYASPRAYPCGFANCLAAMAQRP